MKSKLMLFSVGMLLLSSTNFNAATVYASNGTEVENASNVCANDSYYYETEDSGAYEADIVSTDSRQLLATSNSSNGSIEFSFPANAGDLTVYVYQFKDSAKTLLDTYKFKISDCGYEVVIDDYKPLNIKTTITKTETGYQFTEPNLTEYKLYINQLEKNDDGNSKQVRFKDGIADVDVESDIIQITETYINNKGKEVEQFFEIDLAEQPVIREISSIQLSIIEPLDYLDQDVLRRILIAIVVLIGLFIINAVFIKKLRQKKEYKRQYRLYQQQKFEAAKKKKEQEALRRKRKQELLKQKKLESERRANLEIRK